MSDDGIIIGQIRPASNGSPMPIVTIIRRDGWQEPSVEVRPCEHMSLILDEKWATVTCAKCNEKVDPFSALMRLGVDLQTRAEERKRSELARARLRIDQLKLLKKRRGITTEQAERIQKVINRDQYNLERASIDDLDALVREMEEHLHDVKMVRRGFRKTMNGPNVGWERIGA